MVALQIRREFKLSRVRPVGTIHDAILIEVKDVENNVEMVYNRVLEIMRGPDMLKEFKIKLSVPILGEASIGNWSQGVDLKTWQTLKSAKAA